MVLKTGLDWLVQSVQLRTNSMVWTGSLKNQKIKKKVRKTVNRPSTGKTGNQTGSIISFTFFNLLLETIISFLGVHKS